MKFFVVQAEKTYFTQEWDAAGVRFQKGSFQMRYIESPGLPASGESDRKLSAALARMFAGHERGDESGRNMNMSIIFKGFRETLYKGTLQLVQEGFVLSDMATFFGSDNVRVKVTFTNFEQHRGNCILTQETSFPSKEMTIQHASDGTGFCVNKCFHIVTLVTAAMFRGEPDVFSAFVTVEVEVTVGPEASLEQPDPSSSKMGLLEKMLKEEVHTDVVIITGNGTQVKCHKSVLCASSPVFAAMFQADMKESQTHQIEMVDMSEESVRAFLKWIYYQCEEDPEKDSRIAFELLTAAHKYDVTPDLEVRMRALFSLKPVQWFDLDVAVKLFEFSLNIPTGDVLKSKSIQVLKGNVSTLKETTAYREMFLKNPAAAMQLCELALRRS